jgi:hypothetical protein
MRQEMQQVAASFGSDVAFVEPEILKIDKAALDSWIAKEPRLKGAHLRDVSDELVFRRPPGGVRGIQVGEVPRVLVGNPGPVALLLRTSRSDRNHQNDNDR